MHGRFTSLITLLVAVLAALAVGSPVAERRSPADQDVLPADSSLDSTKPVERVGEIYKYPFDCSFTRQCPPCTDWARPGQVQCCWPDTTASAFGGPGYCLCAPQKSAFDFAASCLGGYWIS